MLSPLPFNTSYPLSPNTPSPLPPIRSSHPLPFNMSFPLPPNTSHPLPFNKSYPLSPNDTATLLQHLNDEKARLYLPVIVYIAILMIVGILGNSLVLLVYADTKRKSSSDYFILSLGILDLISCVVGMPTEIYDLLYPYLFHSAVACKILRYTENITSSASVLILVLVAVDRYFRICQISRALTAAKTKKICIALILIAFIVSIPSLVIFGLKTAKTDVAGITGLDCSAEDWIAKTIYPTLWYGLLMLTFVVSLVVFAALYICIGCQIWKLKNAKIGEGPRGSIAHVSSANAETCLKSDVVVGKSDVITQNSEVKNDVVMDNIGLTKESGDSIEPIDRSRSIAMKIVSDEKHEIESPRIHASDSQIGDVISKAATNDVEIDISSDVDVVNYHVTINGNPNLECNDRNSDDIANSVAMELCEQSQDRDDVTIKRKIKRVSNKVSRNTDVVKRWFGVDVGGDGEVAKSSNTSPVTKADALVVTKWFEVDLSNEAITSKHSDGLSNALNSDVTINWVDDFQSSADNAANHAVVKPSMNENSASSRNSKAKNKTNKHKNTRKLSDRICSAQTGSTRSATPLNPGRTTFILFVVTLVFALSFLPFLVAMVIRSAVRHYEDSLTPQEELVHMFCLKSFFINNAANPLIYSFLNPSFRRRVANKFRQMYGMFR